MSNIKDTESAKTGLSALFGSPVKTETADPSKTKDRIVPDQTLQRITDKTPKGTGDLVTDLISTMTEETQNALQKEVQRRQYLKAGRPPKGSKKKVGGTIPMTFRITPEKQERLREVALKKGLFIQEVLDRSIDLYLAKVEEGEI